MGRSVEPPKAGTPAFDPALRQSEITDMLQMVRFLSREARRAVVGEVRHVAAHCSVPWEAVLGYDDPPEGR
jgi:hypothetical protein